MHSVGDGCCCFLHQHVLILSFTVYTREATFTICVGFLEGVTFLFFQHCHLMQVRVEFKRGMIEVCRKHLVLGCPAMELPLCTVVFQATMTTS